jgi:hypothetical protein
MKIIKENILLILVALFAAFAVYNEETKPNKQVKVTFCNDRPSIIVPLKTHYSGDISYYIDNNRVGVPQWNGYLNVCRLEVIQ